MNYVFLKRFSYNLFIKTLLLFCISILKCFIYRRVNTSKILVVQQFLACLLRIRSRQYLFISSRKSYRPLQLSTAYSQEKLVTRKILLIENISRACQKNLPTCSIYHRVDIQRLLKRLALLLYGNVSSELSYINDYFHIPTFLIDEHCFR